VEARMLLQPRLHLGMLVGGIVVGDQVHSQALGRLGIDPAQELEPFLVAMARHALADDAAGGDLEGGEQGRGSMALVVMRHGAAAALFQRQARLSAIQRLDLAHMGNSGVKVFGSIFSRQVSVSSYVSKV